MFGKEASKLNWPASEGMYFLLAFAQIGLQSMLRFSWLSTGIIPAVCDFLLPPSSLCVDSDLPLYRLALFFRAPLFPADFLCKITGNLLPFSAFVSLWEPLSKVHWFRWRAWGVGWFVCLKIIVNQFILLYMGVQEAEQTSCQVSVAKGGLLAVTDIELGRNWGVGIVWSQKYTLAWSGGQGWQLAWEAGLVWKVES